MDSSQIQLNHLNLSSLLNHLNLWSLRLHSIFFQNEDSLSDLGSILLDQTCSPISLQDRSARRSPLALEGKFRHRHQNRSIRGHSIRFSRKMEGIAQETAQLRELCNDAFNYASKMVSTDMIRFLFLLLCRKSWALKRKLRLPASVTSPDAWLARRQLHWLTPWIWRELEWPSRIDVSITPFSPSSTRWKWKKDFDRFTAASLQPWLALFRMRELVSSFTRRWKKITTKTQTEWAIRLTLSECFTARALASLVKLSHIHWT